jgi:hypothetical protein
MIDFLTKLKISNALNRSRPTYIKNKNARKQANEAKSVLSIHKKAKPEYYKKVAVKQK